MINGVETVFLLGSMIGIALFSVVALRMGATENQVISGSTVLGLLAIFLAVV